MVLYICNTSLPGRTFSPSFQRGRNLSHSCLASHARTTCSSHNCATHNA
ncbi:hypothetical protein MGWOODY_Smn1790 [hydrothermal vent metagenome]|uniref:Uncharacterized protein n=1 Tax=hydrothermal vent metagenome TaxID=652676 RepID=A0A170PQ68_9ZZZZ